MQHHLQPLLTPRSVALVGASERSGSLGRIVYENLLDGGYAGDLYAVNPHHARILGRPALASLDDIGRAVDLAIIASPPPSVAPIFENAKIAPRTAVLMTAPSAYARADALTWRDSVVAIARERNIRLVGPGALGVIRTDIGLNATFCAPPAIPGRLALIAQSGAVSAAMLDFAAPLHIGFSSVISLGGEIDVGFGEVLDFLLADTATDAILLYIEEIDRARPFLSALRAAARTKPVVVLKAGRSVEPKREPSHDAVFDAALRRSGTVRVKTYAQLFAAARILAVGRIPNDNRLAIVSNGRGPALLAADSAAEHGVVLASLAPATLASLDALLPHASARTNPIDIRGDAPPARLAAAVDAAVHDDGVDAVLVLHVARPVTGVVDSARAVADVARNSSKPIFGAWLGALDRHDVDAALESGGVANFFTPETAVEAFAFLAAYRANQRWLLEVPPPQPVADVPDFTAAERVRERAERRNASHLDDADGATLLAAFGMTRGAFPGDVLDAFVVRVTTDAVFGPIITIRSIVHAGADALMLPPLNRRLSDDLIERALNSHSFGRTLDGAPRNALQTTLQQLSALVCALPWVNTMELELVVAEDGGARIVDARIAVDPAQKRTIDYRHMAIHPYPIDLVGAMELRDGTTLTVRPIMPEDAELEREFVHGLSDETRYYRFFYQLHELTPQMLARFTQVDYDRELALVAIAQRGDRDHIVAVARYIASADRTSAEFAIVVADEWQRRGVAYKLMDRLIDAGRVRGLARIWGTVLRSNQKMLHFTRALGFVARDDSDDPEQVIVERAI